MVIDVVVGLDVGTTATKVLVSSKESGATVSERRVPLNWFGDGRPASSLRANWNYLLRQVDDAVAGVNGRAIGIGIASVAESGVLISSEGDDLTSPVAWHDPSGEDELKNALHGLSATEFAGVTGLPITSLCSAAKIAHFRQVGVRVEGATWLTLGEYFAFRMTKVRAAEASLASRTGLFRQDTRSNYIEVVRAVGGDERLLPKLVPAGESFGRASNLGVPDSLRGAAVTVAGHDHLVAAFASGVSGPGEVFNSAGTGDVILSVTSPADNEMRARLVQAGATSGTFLDGENTAIVAGLRGGFVLETVFSAIGATDLDARRRLDRIAAHSSRTFDAQEDRRVSVSGTNKDDSLVTISLGGHDVTPDEIWWAALRELVRESGRLWALTLALVPATAVRCTGGWTRLESVRQAKRRVFGNIEFLPDFEAGARGAAAFAAAAADGSGYAGARLTIAASKTRAPGAPDLRVQ